MTAQFRYQQLADEIQGRILDGQHRAGEKLPSLRKLHARSRLSVTTIYQAYIELEKRGLVESRSKSGFFVKPRAFSDDQTPAMREHNFQPAPVHVNALARVIVEKMSEPGVVNLGGALPDPDYLPLKSLSRILKTWPARDIERMLCTYEHPSGNPDLRREIARRTVGPSPRVMDEIIITNGCMEGVALCLRAVARAGDVIAVESPTFHGLLQLIEDMDMFALEIPADPQTGVSLDHLEAALERHPVKACVFIPSFHNPMGALMPEEAKTGLLSLLSEKNIPLIEDDIYGELHFGQARPLTIKSLDRNGMVLYCSSFSKTLACGLRVGWTMPGRFADRVKRLKINTNISTSLPGQYAVAQFLRNGAYERHLRRLRGALQNHVADMALALRRHLPGDVKISSPSGGMLLWVELGENVDAFEVYKRAEKRNICILPGLICSTSDRYANCIRINCGRSLTPQVEEALQVLGRIISDLS